MKQVSLVVLLMLAMVLPGCIVVPISLPSPPQVKEVVYRDGSGRRPRKIAIVDISGTLTTGGAGEGFFASDSSVVDLGNKLAVLRKDKAVRAVILRIDTPGGGVTASDVMYRELKRFREDTDLPVYVSMQSLAASGGYYVAMAGDQVYASPTTITGSLGVIAPFPEIKGLMDKVGIQVHSVTSGPYKDAGAFYKSMQEDDREIYQSLIDDLYERFLDIIEENRNGLEPDQIRELADGRVYTASQAFDAGLIDGVAYLDEVIDIVTREQNLTKPRVVIIKRTSRVSVESPYARGPVNAPEFNGTTVNLLNVDARSLFAPTNEVFNYLWIP